MSQLTRRNSDWRTLRGRAPRLPPSGRSRTALGLTAAAALGQFELQVCAQCGAVQYPPRESCHRCLSVALKWRPQSGEGDLISETVLHHSHEAYFRARLPWRLGMIRLDCGPTIIAHLHSEVMRAPCRVRILARLDQTGQAALVAILEAHNIDNEAVDMVNDAQLREMSHDPRGCKILITDGESPVGQALARAFVRSRAEIVWVGCAEPRRYRLPRDNQKRIKAVKLDVTNSNSVKRLAGALGANVDILVNTAEAHHCDDSGTNCGEEAASAEMDVNYFGLLRLAQEFGPIMRARGGAGQSRATAWVNILSVYALSNLPTLGTYSASKAAAYSLSQCLRAEMNAAGVRVVNVFPGPLDVEWNRELPPPKLSAQALAEAIVEGLQKGVEDLFPGEVAREWLARWRENPKVLERELAASL
jgi:NAD(P)-dependent dehydrogenase (short-subunit alcohol dehydrogenase family)/uncharacterized OB-fold protein